MFPCIKCGLLTYNRWSKICSVCERADVSKTSQKTKIDKKTKNNKINFPPEPKRPGTQLFDLEICKGKKIKNAEFKYGNLIITFTDKTYIELSGDNQGWGGYIKVILTRAERARRDKLSVFGFKCVDCDHQWLPKKLFFTPNNCPRCRHKNLVTVSSTFMKNDLEEFDVLDK